MQDILLKLIPNVMKDLSILGKSIIETLEMTVRAGLISFVLGMIIGTALVVTKKGGILQNKVIYQVLDKTVNVLRSVPFIILLFCLLPLTRLISGTAIGVKGAIVPLAFGTTPFFSRQIEAALSGVDEGLIEAAQAMGDSSWQIIFRVLWKESVAAIARGTSITLINLVGLTAMAGAVGAGGLGNFAYIYGQQRNHLDDIYVTVLILIVLVMLIQLVGNIIVKHNTH